MLEQFTVEYKFYNDDSAAVINLFREEKYETIICKDISLLANDLISFIEKKQDLREKVIEDETFLSNLFSADEKNNLKETPVGAIEHSGMYLERLKWVVEYLSNVYIKDVSQFLCFLMDVEYLFYVNICRGTVVYSDSLESEIVDISKADSNESFTLLADIYNKRTEMQERQCFCVSFDSEYRLTGVATAVLLQIAMQSKVLKKCENCGRYFIASKRKDVKYCDNPSPQNADKTCKEYGTDCRWYVNQQNNPVAKLSNSILKSKSQLAKRNQDVREYQLSYDYFREERKKWIKWVGSGIKSEEEYEKWLVYMKGQHIIKEALVDGAHREEIG